MPATVKLDTSPSLLILAGGAGRRMGGRDKGLLLWRGEALIKHVLAHSPAASQVLISCNRHIEEYAAYGHPLRDDPATNTGEDYPGPLAGILAGLRACTSQHLLILPCDSPHPPPELYPRLLAALPCGGICHAHDGERDQYLFALITRDKADSLASYLASGQRSVKGWYARNKAIAVDFSDCPEDFVNFNFPEDIGEAH